MKRIKQLIRLIRINHILAKNGLDNVVVSIHLFRPLRFIVYLNPWNWFRKVHLSHGEALRTILEELGPIFVKFGQALSTRPDLLPPEIAAELSKLQDNVPPFSSNKAMAILAEAFGKPPQEVFAEIDPNPLASASMAQVHAATLKSGEQVIVKILRPDMRKIIDQDISIMYSIANFADRYWSEAKRFRPKEVVREFEQTILDELDLYREAANAAELRRNFHNSPLLYVPEIYWDYVRSNILVMERIHGMPVTDIDRIREHGVNIKILAERGVEIFFTQVFEHCFFHADMHPGNIFVSYKHPENPQYICVDFGIIGSLDDEDKRYLAENLYAFFNRDYHRVAQLHVESGWVPHDTRVNEFESAIRTVCEPIFEKPLKEISIGQIMLKLFQVARRFNMEIQPQLILLQKTLLAVEGLGRQLYPDLDLWETGKPYLEKWMRDQIGIKAVFHQLKQNLPFFTEQLPNIPRLLHEVLTLKKQQLIVAKEQQQTDSEKQNTNFNWNSAALGVLASSASLGLLDYFKLINYEQLSILALIGGLASGLFLLINSIQGE